MQKNPRSYKDLVVWQKGIELVKTVYRLAQKYPSEEKFGLVGPMRHKLVTRE